MATRPFLAALAAAGDRRTAANAFISALADAKTARRLFPLRPVAQPWAARAPDERTLNPQDAPPEILATLGWAGLEITLPAAWRGSDRLLCARVAAGWGDCISLRRASPGGQLIGLAVPVATGQPTEIWLMGPEASFRSALAQVGVIPAGALAAFGDGRGRDVTVEIVPGSAPRPPGSITPYAPAGADLVVANIRAGVPGMSSPRGQ